MTNLSFNGEEENLLRTILDERQRELSFEISRTDDHDFKAKLQEQGRLLDSLKKKFVR